MGYVCGDCYPQYNLKLVMPEALSAKLSKSEIDIEFGSKALEQEFDKKQ
jgi:hypothetical protein